MNIFVRTTPPSACCISWRKFSASLNISALGEKTFSRKTFYSFTVQESFEAVRLKVVLIAELFVEESSELWASLKDASVDLSWVKAHSVVFKARSLSTDDWFNWVIFCFPFDCEAWWAWVRIQYVLSFQLGKTNKIHENFTNSSLTSTDTKALAKFYWFTSSKFNQLSLEFLSALLFLKRSRKWR